jgi:hypothetical protein
VAMDEHGEGDLVAVLAKTLQKLRIGQVARSLSAADFAQVLEQVAERCFRHVPGPPRGFTFIMPAAGRSYA